MDEDKITLARLEQLMEENLELAEENHRMLKEMRRMGRVSFWTRVVLWALVIILPLLLLKPVLNMLFPVTGDDTVPGLNVPGFPSKEDIERAIRTYESGELAE